MNEQKIKRLVARAILLAAAGYVLGAVIYLVVIDEMFRSFVIATTIAIGGMLIFVWALLNFK